jgi:hypothetical protein
VTYEVDLDATNEIQAIAPPGQAAFVVKTRSRPSDGQLTVVLDSISASAATDAQFAFDPGPDPKTGQVWDLNKDIDLGLGQSLKVSNVTYNLTDGAQAYLSFEMASQTGVTYVTLFDEAHPLTGAGGGGGGGTVPSTGPFTSELYYLEPLPKGPLNIRIVGFYMQVPGPWEATWAPPN